MAHNIVAFLITSAKGWPFLIVCGWCGLSLAAGLAWATAHWGRNRDQEDADDEAYLEALRDQQEREIRALVSFQQRAAKGFAAGYLRDHIVDIKTRGRRVH